MPTIIVLSIVTEYHHMHYYYLDVANNVSLSISCSYFVFPLLQVRNFLGCVKYCEMGC